MKIIHKLLFVALLSIPMVGQAQIGNLLNKAKDVVTGKGTGLSQEDIGAGLKEALEFGVTDAVDVLSTKDGFLASAYKIEVPREAQKVTSKLKNVPGFENVEKDLVLKMNEAAEIAAKKATPIFVDAIKEITFSDAKNILAGEDDAATTYLKGKSKTKLYEEFMPIIQSALDEVNAREYWAKATKAYNRIPFIKKVNTELDDHVNNKALDGLFALIAEKEKGIREDHSLRTTDLLKKVFGE